MNSKNKKLLSVAIIAILLIWLLYYIKNNIADFRQLSLVNPIYIVYFIIINLIFSFTNGLVIKYLVEPFKIKLLFKEWFGLSVITTFYNAITPFRGGAIARAVYLKKKHNFSYTNFLATLSGVYVINLLVASLLGILSLILIYMRYEISSAIVLLVFLAFFLPTLFIVLFSPKIPEGKNFLANKLAKVINGWHLIRKNKKIVSIVTLTIAVQLMLGVIGTILVYGIFGVELEFAKSLFLVSISYLSIVISITPGAIGISEAVQVFSAMVVGIMPAQSIAAAILGRIISTLILLVLGPIFSYILIKRAA